MWQWYCFTFKVTVGGPGLPIVQYSVEVLDDAMTNAKTILLDSCPLSHFYFRTTPISDTVPFAATSVQTPIPFGP
jgi:hypothetical protein